MAAPFGPIARKKSNAISHPRTRVLLTTGRPMTRALKASKMKKTTPTKPAANRVTPTTATMEVIMNTFDIFLSTLDQLHKHRLPNSAVHDWSDCRIARFSLL